MMVLIMRISLEYDIAWVVEVCAKICWAVHSLSKSQKVPSENDTLPVKTRRAFLSPSEGPSKACRGYT